MWLFSVRASGEMGDEPSQHVGVVWKSGGGGSRGALSISSQGVQKISWAIDKLFFTFASSSIYIYLKKWRISRKYLISLIVYNFHAGLCNENN